MPNVFFVPVTGDASLYFITAKNDQKQTEQLRALVEGFIEEAPVMQSFLDGVVVPEGFRAYFLCNEEGEVKNLPTNEHVPVFLGNLVLAFIHEVSGQYCDIEEDAGKQILHNAMNVWNGN